MTGLGQMLEQLDLLQYLQVFLDEGFDTWATLVDITESDLEALHVKLGHRRKLQRAIIDAKGKTSDNIILGAPQQLGPGEEAYRSEDESGTSVTARKKVSTPNNDNRGGQKRKYRRHPKPDEYAPERPPSAYVIFSNQMRDRLKGQDLSFTEIAKIVGERWQVLSMPEKEPCERQAQLMKEKYYTELNEYKKTPHYARYKEYLVEFKLKQHQQQESKKLKAENGGQNIVRKKSQDHAYSARQSTTSSSNYNDQTVPDWNGSASPVTHMRQQFSSSTTMCRSPTAVSPSLLSPRRSLPETICEDGIISHEAERRGLPMHLLTGQMYRGQELSMENASSVHPTPPNTSYAHSSTYEGSYSPSRHSGTNLESLPLLRLEEPNPTLSSERSNAASLWANQIYTLPAITGCEANSGNNGRVLPSPIRRAGSLSGKIGSRRLEASSSASLHSSLAEGITTKQQDHHSKSSIAALLRAGEQIDRDAAEPRVMSDIR